MRVCLWHFNCFQDNWDDEDEEKEATPPAEATAVAPKKKKPLSQIIQEKEERRRREAEEKRAREEQQRAALTPEEEQAEKLRRQRMQEEADLQLAKEAFGLTESDGIDSLQPVTRDDFDNLRKALAAKLTACERSPHYMGFLDDLLRDLSLNTGELCESGNRCCQHSGFASGPGICACCFQYTLSSLGMAIRRAATQGCYARFL
ncbi:hypothetical protein HPB50_005810 [Hyalomma asiaticum]|uniref:Uncharacterized protein n=1 Tax=Hyalomma asiaticum TaxID=266040 RepID=A0ACB7STD5_HYAAI|nr:hypothetical protein HPB50_005810 [Hyalomma asiaticum]